jgi:hypothetical protein
MACPYFKPFKEAPWSEGRAPLGGIFEGECARGGEGDARLCNFGYARGRCAQFPSDAQVDAVRFSVMEDRLVWIRERDHAPVDHGVIEFDGLAALGEVMAEQARVFVENYRRTRV